MSVVFEEGVLTHKQSLPIENDAVRETVEHLVTGAGVQLDKRFVYHLLASTGICVVPLSSFATDLQGFRITLLETDEAKSAGIFTTIAKSIRQYINSHQGCAHCGNA